MKKYEVYGVGALNRLDNLIRDKKDQAVALYIAYAGVAEWQKTWRIKATTEFMAKRLGWSKNKLQKYKKILVEQNLIEDSQDKDGEGKILAHYIIVHGLIGETTPHEIQSSQIPGGGFNQGVEKLTPSASPTNISASPTNISAKQTPKEINLDFFERGMTYQSLLDEFANGNSPEFIAKEFQKFWLYWTEKTSSGRKQRWETQKTFEVKRRLTTWMLNTSKFSPSKPKGKQIV